MDIPVFPSEIFSHILSFVEDHHAYFSFALCSWQTWQLARRLGIDRPAALQALVDACGLGDTELVERLLKCELYPDSDTIAEASAAAASAGHTAVLELLAHRNQLDRGQVLARGCAESIAWCRNTIPRSYRLAENPFYLAAKEGNLQRLQALHSSYKMLRKPYIRYVVRYTAEYGHLKLLQWMDKTVPLPFDKTAMQRAAHKGHLKVVVWLHRRWKRESALKDVAQAASAGKAVAVLHWLAGLGVCLEDLNDPASLLHSYQRGELSVTEFVGLAGEVVSNFHDLKLARLAYQLLPHTSIDEEEWLYSIWDSHVDDHKRRPRHQDLSLTRWLQSVRQKPLDTRLIYGLMYCKLCREDLFAWIFSSPDTLLPPSVFGAHVSPNLFILKLSTWLTKQPWEMQTAVFSLVSTQYIMECCCRLVIQCYNYALTHDMTHLLPLYLSLLEPPLPVTYRVNSILFKTTLKSPLFVAWMVKTGCLTEEFVLENVREEGIGIDICIYENLQHALGMSFPFLQKLGTDSAFWSKWYFGSNTTDRTNYIRFLRRCHHSISLSDAAYFVIFEHLIETENLTELRWWHGWKKLDDDVLPCFLHKAVEKGSLFVAKWLLLTFPQIRSNLWNPNCPGYDRDVQRVQEFVDSMLP